jgi:hypothetical protein
VPDTLDADDDNDGITDVVEGNVGSTTRDTDRDEIPDHLDLDSDGDGVYDLIENNGATLDMNGDGRIDATQGDEDRDGLATPADSNDRDASVITNLRVPVDTDGDRAADHLDRDSDNDCVPDNDPRERGAARIDPRVPSVSADDNCTMASTVCDRMNGMCVPGLRADAGSDASVDVAVVVDSSADVAVEATADVAVDAGVEAAVDVSGDSNEVSVDTGNDVSDVADVTTDVADVSDVAADVADVVDMADVLDATPSVEVAYQGGGCGCAVPGARNERTRNMVAFALALAMFARQRRPYRARA